MANLLHKPHIKIRNWFYPTKLWGLPALGLTILFFFMLYSGAFTYGEVLTLGCLSVYVFSAMSFRMKRWYMPMIFLVLSIFSLLFFQLQGLWLFTSFPIFGLSATNVGTFYTMMERQFFLSSDLISSLFFSSTEASPESVSLLGRASPTLSTILDIYNIPGMIYLFIPLFVGIILRALDIRTIDDPIQLIIGLIIVLPGIVVMMWAVPITSGQYTSYSAFVKVYGDPMIPFFTETIGEMMFGATQLLGMLGVVFICFPLGTMFPALISAMSLRYVAFFARQIEEPLEEEEEAEIGSAEFMA